MEAVDWTFAESVYYCMGLEESYPDRYSGWWDFWIYRGRFMETEDLMDAWDDWLVDDDFCPCEEDF
jgi:hypothetical protein